MSEDVKMPTGFSWDWPETNVRMYLQPGRQETETVMCLSTSGRYGSGYVQMPLWVWERIREASFARVAPDGKGEQVVRIVLEQPPSPIVAAMVPPAVPSAKLITPEMQRALDQLDRPVGKKGG